ncbi:helix-turn-helix domain-containing protein [Achromobacter sp. UMC71]|uniref:AraC family transcriptional regulator n=1 Tax=Achromobacter sp. UMC71 TaxID=1862320 RepID=UPI001602F7A4|nr:helix-turn-helix transcriptional regulator [Achromobacter sp. UMC71]MBB1627479.1 transcriptional regulator [Achromobacter sp. UMC71]
MPVYSPAFVEDPDRVACPVVGQAIDTRAHASDWHAHQRAQLLYQAQGGVTLYLADRVGQLAPLQAAWLPAGCLHRTVMQGAFAYRSLYFDVDVFPDLPRTPCILDVNPLLREMIVRVTQWPSDQPLDAVRHRLVGTLLDELAAAPTAPLHLPMPRDRRLAPIADALLADPACTLSIEEWGRRVGASGRTLARAFLAETGLPFTRWRTQCRLLIARARLAEGASVTEVAHSVGYASDSAFIAMYRRAYGEPPGRRLRRRAGLP